ncbi:MAG: hypothetical protein QJR08_00450 [Bacillota bacterium]|nr:hypothetical protein [Bacillota bacterium]
MDALRSALGRVRALAADDCGQNTVELIIAMAVLAIILVAGLVIVAPKVGTLFQHAGNCLDAANNPMDAWWNWGVAWGCT